jgi:nitroimidazol reductase NimA-like FMN-containing flavoprotein (pyridoxamine 5'-phosphate oxidase superfamily)
VTVDVTKPVPLERRGDFLVKMYELEDDVCRDLLLRCRVGRVAFTDPVEGLTVHPVNCLVADGVVLFRTSPGSALDRACDGGDVAFEADDVDTVTESGWSVLVRGTASRVTDSDRIAALADTDVHPWAPARHDRWVEIRPVRVTGRIIRRDRHRPERRLPSMPPG